MSVYLCSLFLKIFATNKDEYISVQMVFVQPIRSIASPLLMSVSLSLSLDQ